MTTEEKYDIMQIALWDGAPRDGNEPTINGFYLTGQASLWNEKLERNLRYFLEIALERLSEQDQKSLAWVLIPGREKFSDELDSLAYNLAMAKLRRDTGKIYLTAFIEKNGEIKSYPIPMAIKGEMESNERRMSFYVKKIAKIQKIKSEEESKKKK
jgi:hypothetical protein